MGLFQAETWTVRERRLDRYRRRRRREMEAGRFDLLAHISFRGVVLTVAAAAGCAIEAVPLVPSVVIGLVALFAGS